MVHADHTSVWMPLWKRSIAFRTLPQLTLSRPGPRSPFAHSWRSGKRYWVLSTPPKVNICSHGPYKFGALPRYKRVQLQGQIHFLDPWRAHSCGEPVITNRHCSNRFLGGPTNWLGQHNPTNIKWAEHHQRPDNRRFQKNASFVCQSSKNGDTPTNRYIRTLPQKKDPGIFWCESQLTFQHLMPGPPAASPHTTAVWRYRA